jgi:hypothetical protein
MGSKTYGVARRLPTRFALSPPDGPALMAASPAIRRIPPEQTQLFGLKVSVHNPAAVLLRFSMAAIDEARGGGGSGGGSARPDRDRDVRPGEL